MNHNELIAVASIIKNATAVDENSAIRIGNLFNDILVYLADSKETEATERNLLLSKKLSSSNTIYLDANNAWGVTLAAYLALHPEGAFVIIEQADSAGRPTNLPASLQTGNRYSAFAYGLDSGVRSIILINYWNNFLYVYNLETNTVSRKIGSNDLKTINGESIVGVGNLVIEGGTGGTGGGTPTDYFHSTILYMTDISELDTYTTTGNYGLNVTNGFQNQINMTLIVSFIAAFNEAIMQSIILQSGVEYFRIGHFNDIYQYAWNNWSLKPVNSHTHSFSAENIPYNSTSNVDSALDTIMGAIAVHPTYQAPSTSINDNIQQIVERGSTIAAFDALISFTQRDAGAPTEYQLYKDGEATSAPGTSNNIAVTQIDNLISQIHFVGRVYYNAGINNKPNNLGIADSFGSIPAGFIDSSAKVFTPLLKIFYGDTAIRPSDSASVRSLIQQWQTVNSFYLVTGTTKKIFVIVIPSTKNLVSVIDESNLNLNLTSQYVFRENITVKDAGNNDNTYKLYSMESDIPYPISANHKITLS